MECGRSVAAVTLLLKVNCHMVLLEYVDSFESTIATNTGHWQNFRNACKTRAVLQHQRLWCDRQFERMVRFVKHKLNNVFTNMQWNEADAVQQSHCC